MRRSGAADLTLPSAGRLDNDSSMFLILLGRHRTDLKSLSPGSAQKIVCKHGNHLLQLTGVASFLLVLLRVPACSQPHVCGRFAVRGARQQVLDDAPEGGVKVEEEQGVQADVQHAQHQRGLLPQEQLPPGPAVPDDLGLGQRVRRPHRVVGNEAEDVGQRHERHADQRPPGGGAAAAQEVLEGQAAGDENGGGGVEEERRVEEDGEGVPTEAELLLQGGAAEVPLHLRGGQRVT